MRKTPTLLVGLLATGAIAGTAVAQTAGSHTVDATITPKKAGTKKKPKAVAVKFNIRNERSAGTTASKIEINLPSGLTMNPKGFPVCSESKILNDGVDDCPTKSKLGSGTAGAVVNPTSATPSNLFFSNKFVVGGSKLLTIFLQETDSSGSPKEGGTTAILKGTISNGGRRLSIPIPGDLQQPAPGVYSALTDITTSLKGTTGSGSKKHGFFELSKCTNKKLKVTTKLTYAPNPNPPAAGFSTATDTATCTK